MHGSPLETQVLLDGFGMGESPRWHDGRLWFSNWGTNEIVAIDLDGTSEVIAAGGGGSGWAVDWLHDGRLLITGTELLRVEPDGSRVRHVDLGRFSPHGWSEITVDGRGNAYVNSLNFDFADFSEVLGGGGAPGKIVLVTADGNAREVADGLAFPNGMVVTPDNATLIVAESFAARLTAFDIAADGSLSNRRVWAYSVAAYATNPTSRATPNTRIRVLPAATRPVFSSGVRSSGPATASPIPSATKNATIPASPRVKPDDILAPSCTPCLPDDPVPQCATWSEPPPALRRVRPVDS